MPTDTQEIIEEIETPEVETPVVEGEDGGEPAEKPFAAWELPKPEPKVPTHVPYSRLKEAIDDRNVLFEDFRAANARIKELEAVQEKAAKVKDPDDIKIGDFDNPEDYIEAKIEARIAKARANDQAADAAAEQEKLQTRQLQELGQRYMTNIQAHAAEDPNVTRAKQFFDDYADQVDPLVGRELLSDPNVGHVMVRLATDKKLLDQFFQSTPDQAIRLINRVSARIEAERELTPRQAAEDDETPRRPTPAPMRPDPRQTLRDSLPAQVRPAPAKQRLDLYKDADKMSLAQWRKARSGK